MSPPRVEICGIRLNILVGLSDPVRVEDELVWREEDGAKVTLDALGATGVVAGGNELTAAAPRAFVVYLIRKDY